MNRELLHKYFAGNATPEEEKVIMNWTDTSPANYQFYLKERKYWDALLVHTDLMKVSKPSLQKRNVNFWMFSTIAATIALLFVLSWQFVSEESPEKKWQSVWVPPGQRAQVTLDDGTTVWLNSRSTLTFPSSFDADQREVKLDGEGFFDVEKEEQRPFIVKTEKYTIEVLGTSFNVLAYKDHELFETALLSGSIRIGTPERNTSVITLKPEQKVFETGGKLQVAQINNFDHFRWREGLICLDDERFEDLINKFSLYFDIKITIMNPRLPDYRCTGKFRQSDGVDYALKVLQAELNFSYERNTELNEITIK